MRRAWLEATGLLRLLVLALLLPLGSAGTLPAWARLASEPAHVCKCSVQAHDCVCVRCHPDRPDFASSEASLKGQCGDDEDSLAFSRSLFLIAAMPSVAGGPFVEGQRIALSSYGSDVRIPPPTPPPRA